MNPEVVKALAVLLRNQGRLADMIAIQAHLTRGELQDWANRIGLDAERAAKALESTAPDADSGR